MYKRQTLSLSGSGGASDDSFTPAQSITLSSSTPASNTALTFGDYAVANFGSTRFATDITIANWSTTAYNDFALNSSGLTNISKTGVSKFGTRVSADFTNTAPDAGASKRAAVAAFLAETVGTSSDPKLAVTHSVGSSSAFFLLFD